MKHFKLPKPFAEKWLEALRSGDYQQTNGVLYDSYQDKYCCLGVACMIGGIKDPKMIDCGSDIDGFVIEIKGLKVPEEIHAIQDLSSILAALNDGDYIHAFDLSRIGNLKREKTDHSNFKPLTFHEIADWIEQNVEFYEKD